MLKINQTLFNTKINKALLLAKKMQLFSLGKNPEKSLFLKKVLQTSRILK